MKRPYYYTSLPDADDAPLYFGSFEINGRQLMADGESLHELVGYESPALDNGGAHDAALV